jgi:hypothetical protein
VRRECRSYLRASGKFRSGLRPQGYFLRYLVKNIGLPLEKTR